MTRRAPAVGTWEPVAFIRELRALMDANGISQGALARASSYSKHEVSRWMRGVRRPSLQTMMRLDRALHDCLLMKEEAGG